MKTRAFVLLTSIALLISGCSEPSTPEVKAEDAEKYQGREETKSLQNADNIGYDGTGIQKKLDKALDQNDQRAAELNEQIEAQTGEQPKTED
jgi:PBP1b-binding outer membrane lipoprotein LpoB